ncbi:restriction endonuclease [Burkholderia ubonensis]|uniref:BstXI family restriction endonuclease n=1 Tax=Burkholderia ubonensis TaxID=101571 RepID=UPI000756008D|nr:BstXI family restriction endonuclease [Burkholderia ubonensis]KWF00113.1 restriction endonuclease [Burkholderia ubonensis]
MSIRARAPRVPRLPKLLDRKIYKTGQTRGADDDEIYQNRVSRTSTVLIPYSQWDRCQQAYESGYIVLVSPNDYFAPPDPAAALGLKGLTLGINALVFYETREQWNTWNPESRGWDPADSRLSPLGGQYVARIPATTAAENGGKINRGFTATALKGAGIRVYEYASSAAIIECRLQLEAFVWMCHDSEAVAVHNGMSALDAAMRKADNLNKCRAAGLLDLPRLRAARIINAAEKTICPLCLEELSSHGFFNRMAQAEGRETNDLTITQLNLFHVEELRVGILNHRPYNLGWGHHHCNVVVKDSGIVETLEWMRCVVDRNIADGHLPASTTNSGI